MITVEQKAIGSLKAKRRSAAALWPKKNLALENIEITQVTSENLLRLQLDQNLY